MKTRWKVLTAIGIFMLLAMGSAWVTGHHQPESALEDYKKLLRDRGEKLELSEVLPQPVLADSNSLVAVQDAFRMFGSGTVHIPQAMRMVAPGKAMISWMQPDARNREFTNTWEGFASTVDAARPGIELLHEVLERPKLDFQLDYKQGAKLLLPQLMKMRRASEKLEAAVICDLHNRDTGAAATNILTMLALVDRSKSEGLLISQQNRIVMASTAISPTWEFLQASNVTEAELAAVQKSWEQMGWLSQATNVFAVERAWVINEIQIARATHQGYEDAFSWILSSGRGGASSWETLTERPRNATGEVMWRASWSYDDELRSLKTQQIILEALRTMQTNRSEFYRADYDVMASRLAAIKVTNPGGAIFHALKIPDMSDLFDDYGLKSGVKKTIKMEMLGRVVTVAVALKRYQLKHGKWPATLDEMTPEFFLSVPIDPYDGKPLRYRPNPDGTYLLYSVGDDGKDDGGNPNNATSGVAIQYYYWQDDHAYDRVWPQAATAAEIQFFYDNPPK